jgi:hypothetical protein
MAAFLLLRTWVTNPPGLNSESTAATAYPSAQAESRVSNNPPQLFFCMQLFKLTARTTLSSSITYAHIIWPLAHYRGNFVQSSTFSFLMRAKA